MDTPNNDYIPACCQGEKCNMCGEQAKYKVEEVLFDDDPTAYNSLWVGDQYKGILSRIPVRHPCTAYVCIECFGKIMGFSHSKKGN